MERWKELWKRRGALITAVGVTLLVVGLVILFALTRSGDANRAGEVNYVFGTYTPDPNVTRDPAATPTRPPEVLMVDMIGDWYWEGSAPSGITELHLHGDNTAAYVICDLFDPQPRTINTRWQAQEDLFSLIIEGSEVMQYELRVEGDSLTLTDARGVSRTYVRRQPATVTDAAA